MRSPTPWLEGRGIGYIEERQLAQKAQHEASFSGHELLTLVEEWTKQAAEDEMWPQELGGEG